MSATTATSAAPGTPLDLRAPVDWKYPVVYAVLALVTLLGFGLFSSTAGKTTVFSFSAGSDLFHVADLHVSAWGTAVGAGIALTMMAGISAFLATKREKPGLWFPVLFGVLFLAAFLTWAGADTGRIPVTPLLAGALALSVPLIFGAMCGLVGERSGVVNIAIEGQLLAGAFLAAVVASSLRNPYAGLIAAPIAGALVAVLLSIFAIRYWVDQIIIGVVLNVLVVGLTNFLFSTVLTADPEMWNARQALPILPVPLLSDIPVIGPVFFRQTILVYLMYVAVAVIHIMLFHSRWGLRTRAIGEHPKAADTVGIRVNRSRVVNVLIAGGIAGLGGAFFTVGSGLAFGKEMSAGQGFIALAAMILGRWSPIGAVCAALLFGFARNLGNTLSTMGTPVPSDLLLMLPYIVTIFAVAGFVGRVRPPAANGKPYTTQ